MPESNSAANCCEAGRLAMRPTWSGSAGTGPPGTPRATWVAPTLSTVIIVATVLDVVGNLLVIFSVLRNRKLRNAGKYQLPQGWVPSVPCHCFEARILDPFPSHKHPARPLFSPQCPVSFQPSPKFWFFEGLRGKFLSPDAKLFWNLPLLRAHLIQ